METGARLSEVCCHTDYMQGICKTLHKGDLVEPMKLYFLVDYFQCPYSFSLSFLNDQTILGKDDSMGQNKYNLNLDEAGVHRFYDLMKESINGLEDEERKGDEVLMDLYRNQVGTFKDRLDEYLESESLESQYMIP